jgi:hypothetical protein
MFCYIISGVTLLVVPPEDGLAVIGSTYHM